MTILHTGPGDPWHEPPEDKVLPNGFRRSDYHRCGISDEDIELWGLDQPGAPPPEAAGWAVWDLLDEMDDW